MNKRKILITGKGSYIGTSLIKWLEQWPDQYEIVELSVRGTEWKLHDFSIYDVVLHVAGIAHVSADPNMEQLYYQVNRDLTIEVATKAKQERVKQFIFMSSIIVYGNSSSEKKVIDRDTIPKPSNFYGNSKLQAEQGLNVLQDANFNVVILRPPMIYGKGSKGNYPRLARMAVKFPIFPDIDNERSMLHIDNLCELIRLIEKNMENGVFYPQNKEYVKTSKMVKLIAEAHGKKIRLTKLANNILVLLEKRIGILNKVFGNLVFEKNMSEYKENYCVWGLEESIKRTEVAGE